jgi:hypothetical protein
MRVVFVVAPNGEGWSVRKGATWPLHYESPERAIASAENFAQATAAAGDTAVVMVEEQGELREHRRFPRSTRRSGT